MYPVWTQFSLDNFFERFGRLPLTLSRMRLVLRLRRLHKLEPNEPATNVIRGLFVRRTRRKA